MQTLIRSRSSPSTIFSLLSRNLSTSNFFTSSPRNTTQTGLYGFNLLKSPKGFQIFVDEAIQRSSELVNYVSRSTNSMEIIRAMDEISDTVCSVVDSAELCRNTHPDKEFVEEATNASIKINEHLHFLNTNHTLYNAVLRTEQSGLTQTDEARRAAHSLRVDFEKGGIHLSADKLQRVNELNVDIAHLCREFGENMMIDPGAVDIFPDSRIPKHIQHLLKPIYRSTAGMSKDFLMSRKNRKEKGFRITTDSSTLSSVLQWVSDDEVRKEAYILGNSSPHANLDILDRLIKSRHELAQMMGHRSFADFSVHPNLASSPEVVMSFLHELSNTVRPKADQEFNAIRDFKRQKCNRLDEDLEPWDETYLTGIMKSAAYNLESSVISSYFPLSQCLEGLNVLVQSLFGASFCSIPLAPGESWHRDVLKMALHHPEEGDLGYLYLDLHARKGKYPGCAHFAIKGGRRISETDYQLPIVALVCNFSAPPGSSTARLNHSEVETLFHEFGHALHSLLSRTDYQHFSGTRVVIDLAETPSNLFEYYAWDYRFLKTFAKHYLTGEVIPEKLVESMKNAKKMFAATEMQRQIYYAMIDQTLFGEQTLSSKDTISIVANLKRQYTSWKYVEGTHWHTRFNHLLNYGSGYYSYLYAKCFAATIWQEVCVEDPLSRDAGLVIRTKLLQHGGAKDASSLLKDLVGDHILRYQEGGIMPDLSCVCKEMDLCQSEASSLLQKAC
ncbi:mitochondrial intermediate peptidase [Ranunculus cassubicifolius]